MRSFRLEQYDLPNIVVYEDGTVYDSIRDEYIGKPTDPRVLCKGESNFNQRLFTRPKLIKECFNAPWNNGIECIRLDKLDLSRYYATRDGKIFGIRNMDYVKPHLTRDGYYFVNLYSDSGDYLPWRVHRLIATTYIPNPDGKDTVDHINNIKTDNRVENLRWMWMWENIDHRSETTGNVPTKEKIREICSKLEAGMRPMEVSKACNVKWHIVKGILEGSHYRVAKDYNIPKLCHQRRLPVELVTGVSRKHAQNLRVHGLPDTSSSTTIS